ncbi:MAG: hypothetical protein JW759_01880 [Candidatus Coatesbacteria bacterium]|nr:hypothetical protein [Candidatus Coatesbacteria bacterium]
MHVAVIYSKGPTWSDEDPKGQLISRHIAHQRRNFEAGKLVMGGPFIGEHGGMAILEVDSMDEAQQLVQSDPAVSGGFYVVALHPWRVVQKRSL